MKSARILECVKECQARLRYAKLDRDSAVKRAGGRSGKSRKAGPAERPGGPFRRRRWRTLRRRWPWLRRDLELVKEEQDILVEEAKSFLRSAGGITTTAA